MMTHVTVDIASSWPEINDESSYDLVIFSDEIINQEGFPLLSQIKNRFAQARLAPCFGVYQKADMIFCQVHRCDGSFTKTMSGRLFRQGIATLLSGQNFYPVMDVALVVDKHERPLPDLTSREYEVLRYLGRGLSNKDIAHRLGIQVVTVKLHIRGICRKMSVSNRTQAALKGKACRLI
jgi:DNA-binding NarL/FixJ family response regulator